ncbi:MAG: DUF11 domain-containing protein [Acidobacteria bacterium]|nr:DUF11 domain-containing protein [Acidobacteriota bacterium]
MRAEAATLPRAGTVTSLDPTVARSPEAVEAGYQQAFELKKDADKDSYCPGDLITYTLTFTNNTQVGADVIIMDDVPAGTSFVSATAGGMFDPTPAPGNVTWDLGMVTKQITVVSYTVRVDCSIQRGATIDNQAQATIRFREQTTQILSNSIGIPAGRQCPVCIEKTVDKASVCPGDFLTYTISVRNPGISAIGPVLVVDSIPANTTFVSANLGGMFTPAPPPGQVSWNLASIPPAATVVLSFTVQVNCDVRPRTILSNQAAIRIPGAAPIMTNEVQSVVSANCPPVSFPCDGPPWAEREITVEQYPPILGQPNKICVTVVNNTSLPTSNCTLTFGVIPFSFGAPFVTIATLTNVMLVPGVNTICVPYTPMFSGHTCVQVIIHCPGFPDLVSQRNLDNTEVIPPGGSDSLSFLICNPDPKKPQTINTNILAGCPGMTFMLSDPNPTLAPGECLVETLTVMVDASVPPGTMCTVDVVGYLGNQLVGGIEKTFTVGQPRCIIRKRADRQIVCPGDLIKYTIDAYCPDAKMLLVKDFVPANTTFVSASAPGLFDPMTGEVAWLFPGTNNATMTLVVRVDASAPPGSTIIDVAQIEAPGSQASNPVTTLVSRECQSGIRVVKNVDRQLVCPGEFLNYAITITNNTAAAIGPFNVVDPVPAGTTFVAANLGGVYNPAPPPGVVTWTIPSLAPGASVTLVMTVQVDCDTKPGTTIANRASVLLAAAPLNSNTVVSVVGPNCPPVTHPCDGPPWAETTIQLEKPPIVGETNQICAVIMNNSGGPLADCVIRFGFTAGFSMGAVFFPIGEVTRTLLPGNNLVCIPWTPNFSGHGCLSATIDCPGFPVQISARNIDTEIVDVGQVDRLQFLLCNPTSETQQIQTNVLVSCPGVTAELSNPNPILDPGECIVEYVTVHVGPGVPAGTMCNIDVVEYIDNELIGGVRKIITVGTPHCRIVKKADRDTACPGDIIDYLITAQCNGQAGALVITDAIPGGTSFMDASDGGMLDPVRGVVTWVIKGGMPAMVHLRVMVDPDAPVPGLIRNIAQVELPESRGSEPVDVRITPNCPPSRLTIKKTVDKKEVCPCDFLHYTVTVTNNTAAAIGPLKIIEPVPVGTVFVAASAPGIFSPAPAPGLVTWIIPALGAGASVNVSMTVQVPCTARPGKPIINRAVVVDPTGLQLSSDPTVTLVSRNCPPVTHPFDGPPWAETTITLQSEPPILGRANQICAGIVNNTGAPISDCTLLFGVLPFGFGASFSPVGTLTNVMLQPGMNTICVPYTPSFTGHTCVQVIIRCPGFPDQISQRNLDNTEIIPPGGSDSLQFTVCNPDPNNPSVIQLNTLISCPGVTVTVSPSVLNLGPGQCQTVILTVNVAPGVPAGTMCVFDVVGYLANTIAPVLVGGVQKKITVGSPGCAIRKRANKETAAPGDTIIYTIDVQCQESPKTLLFTDKVPDHTTFVSATGGGIFNAITGEVTWMMSGPSSASVNMTVRVDPNTPRQTVIRNMAQLQLPFSASSNVVNVLVP